jgi:hypothetical protein
MIEVTNFNACYTIAFFNSGLNEHFVWVCTNQDSFERSLKLLREISHVKILQAGASHVRE